MPAVGTIDGAHLRDCAACRHRLAVRAELAAALRQRPVPPPVLFAPSFPEAIHERILAAAESGPLGALLEVALPVGPSVAAPTGSAAAGPQGDTAAVAGLLDSALTRGLLVAPPPLSEGEWAKVQQVVRAAVQPVTPALRWRRWWLAAAGVAAAAAMFVSLSLSDGTSAEPTIVFTDLEAMPGVEFAVLRHGILR